MPALLLHITGPPDTFFPSEFPTKILYEFIIASMLAAAPHFRSPINTDSDEALTRQLGIMANDDFSVPIPFEEKET
jgi:hypothetical protein